MGTTISVCFFTPRKTVKTIKGTTANLFAGLLLMVSDLKQVFIVKLSQTNGMPKREEQKELPKTLKHSIPISTLFGTLPLIISRKFIAKEMN